MIVLNKEREERLAKQRAANKRHYEKNRESVLEKQREYYSENREAIRERQKQSESRRIEEVRKRKKEWRDSNQEKARESSRKSYEKHKAKRNASIKEYRKRNREKAVEANRAWRNKNKDKVREYTRKSDRKKLSTKAGRIENTLRARLHAAVTSHGKSTSRTLREYLGMGAADFCKHIESLWTEGMSWDNYPDWEVEHTVPIAPVRKRFGVKGLRVVFNWRNCTPMWKKTNREKGTSVPKDSEIHPWVVARLIELAKEMPSPPC